MPVAKGANRVPQPYKAQVFLKIGNTQVTVVPPEHLISFTYMDNMMTGGDTFEIELFDRDVFVVENLLHRNTDIEMQWGYPGNMSRVRKGMMLEYELTSIDGFQGVLLKVTGMDQNTDRGTSEKKTRAWVDKPIHQIALDIAKEHNWTAKAGACSTDPTCTVEECRDIYDQTHASKAVPNPKNRFQQNDVSDLQFLRSFCTPGSGMAQAVSKHTAQSDYRFGIDADGALHFRPLRWMTGDVARVQRKFVYPDPEGGVLSFTPSVSAPLLMKLGAETVVGRTRHGTTGEEIYVTRDPVSLKVFLVDPKQPGIKTEITDKLKDGLGKQLNAFQVNPKFLPEFSVADDRSSSDTLRDRAAAKRNQKSLPELTANTPETAALEVHAWWMKYLSRFFAAELTTLGDPTLNPTDFDTDIVDVTFLVRGQQHYTSGLYQVFSVMHNIDQNGKYITKLEMQSADIFRNNRQ